MPRTTLPKIASPGPNPTTGTAVTFTAADAVNGNQIALTGRELLLIQNNGGSSATYTVSSVADGLGRLGDITAASIAAGAIVTLGPFGIEGWQQSDGYLYLSGSSSSVRFAVLKLA